MSGTSSTQPGPTEAAPLTPEQRKAYEEIGAARSWLPAGVTYDFKVVSRPGGPPIGTKEQPK